MSMSGVAFWSHDIGGFMGETNSELFIRWAQWGLLSSHSRAHGTAAREPWSQGEQALTIFREYDELRYQLIPYLYSLAHDAHRTGLPVMRPMVLEYQSDPATMSIDTQYMLGPSIIVVPVLEAGAHSVRVYLPAGTWYSFWTDTAYTGGRWLTLPANLEWIPIFVKAGTILPLGPIRQHTGEQAAEHGGPDELTLKVYPLDLPDPATASTVLYEEGGGTAFAYADGQLAVAPSPGAPQSRTYTVVVVAREPKTVTERVEGAGVIQVQDA
jgi:alpha-D-xyloside xylohydrolase